MNKTQVANKVKRRLIGLDPKTKSIIKKVIDHHEKWKHSYFWSSPGNASQRKSNEEKNSFIEEFELDGNKYKYESKVRCSCKNIYYTGEFFINGTKKDIRLFKSLGA